MPGTVWGAHMQVTKIDALFSPHYYFLNTKLLGDIIEKFVGEPLKNQLEKYMKGIWIASPPLPRLASLRRSSFSIHPT